MKKADVDKFISLSSRIESLHDEIGLLSKKNPNDGINKFKLKAINSIITEANDFLKESRPLADFNEFEDDDVPTNSDVVFVLGLYEKSLEQVRSANISVGFTDKEWYWDVEGSGNIRTNPPKVM